MPDSVSQCSVSQVAKPCASIVKELTPEPSPRSRSSACLVTLCTSCGIVCIGRGSGHTDGIDGTDGTDGTMTVLKAILVPLKERGWTPCISKIQTLV